MDQSNVVFDISSDDEADVVGQHKAEDFEWLTKMLGEDDDGDVVVVGEVTSNPKLKLADGNGNGDGDGDDDCVILDGDPDEPIAVAEDTSDRSDELRVVGEKGMVACRDYPHSRHLCVKFRFDTTPHESFCDQCHCYVCDSLAPCLSWNTGNRFIDHCHATDKEEIWKSQRKNVKLGKSGLLPVVPKLPPTPQMYNQAPPLIHYNPQPRHPVQRPTVLRPCSSSQNNYCQQNNSNQRLAPTFHKNRLHSRVDPSRLVGVRNNVKHRRYQNPMNTSQRYGPSPPMFKRSASVRPPIMTPTMHPPSFNQPHVANLPYLPELPPYHQNFDPPPNPIDKSLHSWPNSVTNINYQPNTNSMYENSQHPQPAVHFQPAFEPIVSQNIDHRQNQILYPTDSRFSNSNGLVHNITQTTELPMLQNSGPQSAELIKESSLVPDCNGQTLDTEGNPAALYFDFEEWLMKNENSSFPTLPQVDPSADPSQLMPHEESPQIDHALLYFDFETSMDGLTK